MGKSRNWDKWIHAYIGKSVIYLVPKCRPYSTNLFRIYRSIISILYVLNAEMTEGLPCFASKFTPWQCACVVCEHFSEMVNSFAYRCHSVPKRTEMDWNRQKWTCESRNWIYIVKESRNFGNYIKIGSKNRTKYGISWIRWFQVYFNTLHQHFLSFVLYILHCPLARIMCRWIASCCHGTKFIEKEKNRWEC